MLCSIHAYTHTQIHIWNDSTRQNRRIYTAQIGWNWSRAHFFPSLACVCCSRQSHQCIWVFFVCLSTRTLAKSSRIGEFHSIFLVNRSRKCLLCEPDPLWYEIVYLLAFVSLILSQSHPFSFIRYAYFSKYAFWFR